jgi:hypothetical protein
MKLKLDLHPIFNDAGKIEAALQTIIDEAVDKRATEIEVIPGKGSGALKKTVLRYLDRPEVKARYHRIEKDSDNWGRLFVHFRPPLRQDEKRREPEPGIRRTFRCFCCEADVMVDVNPDEAASAPEIRIEVCPSCGSPNRLSIAQRRGGITIAVESGYE